jgi:hypothetical protein
VLHIERARARQVRCGKLRKQEKRVNDKKSGNGNDPDIIVPSKTIAIH